ncbi:AAA family ATPase [Methylorubrum podarium]|uniref:AAA family ATPase n=1 Tax=Methylorubrum podarium TaxID=200476 RepID=A0ABV1QST5_9HYPH
MHIAGFRLYNYASFRDSLDQSLDADMNVVVGQNNVGKSALLEALSLSFGSKPHRSSASSPDLETTNNSRIVIELHLKGPELVEALLQDASGFYMRSAPDLKMGYADYFNNLLTLDFISVIITLTAYDHGNTRTRLEYIGPIGGEDINWSTSSLPMFYNTIEDKFRVSNTISGSRAENTSELVLKYALKKIYFFSALRTPRSSSQFGRNHQLHPDASNLAEVLGMLQGNRSAYERYVKDVRRVLPAVKWISVQPSRTSEGFQEVMVWNIDASTEREDLANPLSECGTGVGHILSILYVLHRSSGDIMIVDEPNSFLHPGAARMLASILRESKQHQFILSTHAPEVISSARPNKILNLKLERESTVVFEASTKAIDHTRTLLNDLGVRLSDVLGYDRVVWVEGPTEVQALPILLEAAGRHLSSGIVFAAMRSTGDLENKQAVAFAEMYDNLSRANSLLPNPMVILLDGDKRGASRIEVLNNTFPEALQFLSRRTYENYLLSVPAIAALINTFPSFDKAPISESVVEDWLRARGNDKRYGAQADEVFSERWNSAVDSSKMLPDLIQEVSESTEIYRKPFHSVWLTQWLVENERETLNALASEISAMIPG